MNRLAWYLAAALSLVACRDLQFPTGDAAVNEPPVVSFVTPVMDQQVPLVPMVQVEARDPNGIADVTLFCGGAPVYVWTAPPYLASVDLSRCSGLDLGNGVRAVELAAVARDSLLLASEPTRVTLRQDVAVAQLSVALPARAAPLGRLEVRITSDRTLGAYPSAKIGSLAAQVTERTDLEGAGAPLTIFDAVIDPLPGAAPAADGGTDVPLEVLEAADQVQLVEIEGRATSGNVTRTVLQLVLSRVAWQRSLLGPSSPGAAGGGEELRPVATDAGLVMPMTVSSGWLPAYFSHANGTFTPFGRTDLLRDAGYSLHGLDGEGRALLVRYGVGAPTAEYTFVAGPSSPQSAPVTTDHAPNGGLVRVAGGLCQEVTDGGYCSGTFTRTLVCATPQGDLQSALAGDPQDSEGLYPGAAVTSGDVYWATRYPTACKVSNVAFSATPGGAARVSFPLGTNDPPPDLMTSFENGSVALTYRALSGAFTTFTVGPDGRIGPSFFSDAALQAMGLDPASGLPPWSILAGRPDGALLTVRYEDPYTVIEAWTSGAAAPLGRFRIPGYYAGNSPFTPLDPVNSVVGVDGSVALVLVAPQPGYIKGAQALFAKPYGDDLVLFIDAQLRPRWLYRPGSSSGYLYGNRTGSHLYYVDESAQQITALAR